jgi:hypothetical protein
MPVKYVIGSNVEKLVFYIVVMKHKSFSIEYERWK